MAAALTAEITAALNGMAVPQKAVGYLRYFKTAPGQYAHGDKFIGVTVPNLHKAVRHYAKQLTLPVVQQLLQSEIHEYRHFAALALGVMYKKAQTDGERQAIAGFYVAHRARFNNWDLVDNSAYKVLGPYCYATGNNQLILQLANEDSLWSVRIAIVATMYHIKQGSFTLLQQLVVQHMGHKHDLIHKASGWLLREMGKQSEPELLNFLNTYAPKMPRTMLRYAIERLDVDTRQRFLKA